MGFAGSDRGLRGVRPSFSQGRLKRHRQSRSGNETALRLLAAGSACFVASSKSFVFTADRLIDYDEEVSLFGWTGVAPSHSIQWSRNDSSLEYDHVIGSEKPGV